MHFNLFDTIYTHKFDSDSLILGQEIGKKNSVLYQHWFIRERGLFYWPIMGKLLTSVSASVGTVVVVISI